MRTDVSSVGKRSGMTNNTKSEFDEVRLNIQLTMADNWRRGLVHETFVPEIPSFNMNMDRENFDGERAILKEMRGVIEEALREWARKKRDKAVTEILVAANGEGIPMEGHGYDEKVVKYCLGEGLLVELCGKYSTTSKGFDESYYLYSTQSA